MAKHFNELLDIIRATDEDSADEFLKLMQPEKYDRMEMRTILETTVGHDLITYYDKKEIAEYLQFIENHDAIDDDVKSYIKENRETAIEECYEAYEDLQRTTALHLAVESFLEAVTGVDVTSAIGDDDLELIVEGDDDDIDDIDDLLEDDDGED